jgi:dTDP-4-amino-4,6-dideoxygalactose transaminase
MSYWKDRVAPGPSAFPIADRYFAGAVTLPLFPGMTDAQVDRVADVLCRIVR